MNLKTAVAAAVPGFFVGGPIGAAVGFIGGGLLGGSAAPAVSLPPATPGAPASVQASSDLVNMLTSPGAPISSPIQMDPVLAIQRGPQASFMPVTPGAAKSSQGAADFINSLVAPPVILTSGGDSLPPTAGGGGYTSPGPHGKIDFPTANTPGIMPPVFGPQQFTIRNPGITLPVQPNQLQWFGDPSTYEDALASGWSSTGVAVNGLYTVASPDGTTMLYLPSAAAGGGYAPGAVSSGGAKKLLLVAGLIGAAWFFWKK